MAQDGGERKYVARLPTIRSQIYGLVWACALPAVLGFALLTNNFIARERTTIQQDTLITARALIQAVDRDLNTGITVAMALANSPSLDSGDLAAFYRQASEVLRPEFPGYNFVLHDRNSVQRLNTARPYGELYPDPISAPRIEQVFATGKPIISNLFNAGALKRPLAAIHAPVLRNGKVIYVISVAFVPERLGQVLREQRLPPDRVAGIFDADGVLVARTHDPERYVGQKVSADLLKHFPLRQEDAIEANTLEGTPVFSMYSRSAQTGWSVVIGVPRSAVYAEMLASIRWITLLLAVLTAAGFGIAWRFARSIERSVRALTSAAMALGGQQPDAARPPYPAFQEAAQAVDTLESVEAELLRYRHHLENLIGQRTRELAEAMRAAQQANAAKDVFVANMSHELRTPMNAVLGVAHLLGTTGVSPEQARYLDMIRTSGQSLLGILNDILDLSKMQAGKVTLQPVRFELDEVLHAVATIMSVSAGDKALELAIGVAPDVPQAFVGDALRLQQILVNLAGNAIKFTERGEVALRVTRLPSPDGAPMLLRFSVRDTGMGLSEDQLARLFTPFTQADVSTTRRFGGTGLGLTISKGLIELLGGAIEVHSTPGAGSEFHFTVPIEVAGAATSQGQAAAVDAGASEACAPAPLHLLLVDDHAVSRACIADTIAAAGWTCDSVAGGPAALERLRAGGRYDVMLVDWQMPDMGGQATIAAMQALESGAAIPVICMVNAYGSAALVQEMAGVRLAGQLSKPVTLGSLRDTVRAALDRASQYRASPRPVSGGEALSGGAVTGPNGQAGGSSEGSEDGSKNGSKNGSNGGSNSGGRDGAAGGSAAALPVLAGVHILLVEDNPINQVVARGILAQAGARVAVAENGEAALASLRTGGCDLVLMDVQMPVMDGYTATRLIREELGLRIPVIAMTAGVMASEREQCIAAGMDDFIGKPIDIEQMFATLARHLPAAPH